MAKSSGRKLKVFQTRIGFHDTVVAAASRAAALRAWGVRRDLFTQGLAEEIQDPDIVAAAVEHPDIPLKRPAGSSQPFSIDPARPKVSEIDPEGAKAKPASKEKPPKPPPSRAKLDAAETALAKIERDHERRAQVLDAERKAIEAEERALSERRAALQRSRAEEDREYQERRAKAAKTIEKEARAFRAAGGDA